MSHSVSVIIPAYRSARTIGRAIDSLLAQTQPPAEIIVVDDGSPDDLASALARFGDAVTCIRKPNGGAASARNAGIDASHGDLIAFLDADDYWEPQKLAVQTAIFEKHPEVGLVAGRYFIENPGAPRQEPAGDEPQWFDHPLAAKGSRIFELASRVWTGTVLVCRSTLANDRFIKGFEPAEDRDLWIRLVLRQRAYLLNQPLATAVMEPDSLSRSDPDFGYGPMIRVLHRHGHLIAPSQLRRLEANVYRGWASAHLARGDGRRAIRPAIRRLNRQPSSAEAWYIAAKALVMSITRNRREPMRSRDGRDETALRRHFEIERALANRLRAADADQRRTLYGQVYNELFQRVADHPQNQWKADPAKQKSRIEFQWRLLSRFCTPDATYMEIGAGDCGLAMHVASHVRMAYAVDVSDAIAKNAAPPPAFKLVISDGTSTGVPTGAATIAYSNQLMEHLHPDDAARQLREIVRSLGPGGKYLCVTPHRFSGPHDISRFFTETAEGFHLKEYTYGELRQTFLDAGFASTSIWTGLKGRFFRMPQWIVLGSEKMLAALPPKWRTKLTRSAALRPVFTNVMLLGMMPGKPNTITAPSPQAPVLTPTGKAA